MGEGTHLMKNLSVGEINTIYNYIGDVVYSHAG